MEEKEIGEITHFFNKICVCVIRLKGGLNVGDKVHVKGGSTDFEQTIDSIQVNHKNIESAEPGDDVGIKLTEPAKVGDKVYLVIE